jgi:hypothetical protein
MNYGVTTHRESGIIWLGITQRLAFRKIAMNVWVTKKGIEFLD